MKNILLYILLLLIPILSQAQDGDKRAKIEAAKIAYISQRINLSPAQAEKFWPLYNEYNDKKAEIRRSMRKLRVEATEGEGTEEELKADLQTMMNLKQKELDLEKEYLNKYLSILSAKQVALLLRAEKEFMRKLVEKLAED